ncbi:HAD family hydrolase [Pseudofrancisella aestuarii]|uniref:phosphoglycolate phosphatase n=1 Tax=Pseudofrancisella aestuarii TaxID=2670347 RepID=A0ABV9TCA1_9GAMM|nr:HAD family hydrolase [Pseudofrancisella aestuarii]
MKLAIFDFDGTICDTKDSVFYSIKDTYLKYSVKVNDKIISETLKKGITLENSLIHINESLNLDIDVASLVLLYREIYNETAYKNTYLYKGIKDLLEKLFFDGVNIIIVSNKGSLAIEKILNFHGLRKYIGDIFGADSAKYKKPSVELYEYIKTIYKHATLGKTYIIGDTETDIIFAKNCGANSIFVKYGYGDSSKCVEMSPDLIIESCDDLMMVSRHINK